MSCSKPLPSFTLDLLCYLNRDQLERFSIVCRPLKNFIDRYFHSKPYRIFENFFISGGSYALRHNFVGWHPNRCDYSVQQFLAGQRCNTSDVYYSLANMRSYLGASVRIKYMTIFLSRNLIYNPEHIAEMESIAYIWSNGKISIQHSSDRIIFKDFLPILNSPTILQCRELRIYNANFPFKNYNVLYSVNIIEIYFYDDNEINLRLQYWQQFLEHPGVKPIVVFSYLERKNIDNLLDRLSKAFSSAALPNAFKIVFVLYRAALTKFRVTNKKSSEIFELKKGIPLEFRTEYSERLNHYTLERSSE